MKKESLIYKGVLSEGLRKINFLLLILSGIVILALLIFAVSISIIGINYFVKLYGGDSALRIVFLEAAIILLFGAIFLYVFIYHKNTFEKSQKTSRSFASFYIGMPLLLSAAALILFIVSDVNESGIVIKCISAALLICELLRLFVMLCFSVDLDKEEKKLKKEKVRSHK